MNYNNLFKRDDDMGCFGYILLVIFVIALAFGFSCLNAWIAMLLWNWVMPMIWATAPVMTFWPMWCLVELCGILFRPRNYNSNNNK